MESLENLQGLPLYVKIREALRNDIIQGKLKKGERLLSEDNLAKKYDVSRMTLRQGINDLVDEGLLYRKKGIGTFVSKIAINRDHSKLNSFLEDCRAKGIDAQERMVDFKVVKAKHRIANTLNILEKDPVYLISTIINVHGETMSYHDIYVSFNLFPTLSDNFKVGNDVDLWGYFRSQGYSIRRGVERIEAKLADEMISNKLKVAEGFPILYKERTLFSEDGTALALQYCNNRGDLYSLTISLSR